MDVTSSVAAANARGDFRGAAGIGLGLRSRIMRRMAWRVALAIAVGLGGLTAASLASTAAQEVAIRARVALRPATVSVTVRSGAPISGETVNQDLVGVDGPGPAAATVAMAAVGVRWVRTDVGFEGSYDCATRTWDPTALDRRVDQIHAEGAQPLLIVDYTPSCLAPFSAVPAPGSINYEPPDVGTQPGGASDQSIWQHLVTEMATHEVARGVRAFEVWNEPDGTFWYGGLPGYLHLYADTAPALEAGAVAAHCTADLHCGIEVGGPALVFPDSSWLEPFLAYVSAQHLPLDFVSWHYYGDYPLLGPYGPIPAPPGGGPPPWYNPALRAQTYGAQVAMVRAQVEHFPLLHPLLWLDEWNVDAGYDARQSGPYDAAFAAAVLDSVQSQALDRMAFFDVADSPTDPEQNWGMLTGANQPKAVYWAFTFWHALAPDLLPVVLSPPGGSATAAGGIGAVGSRSPDGVVTVLLYNFVPYDPTGSNGVSPTSIYDRSIVLRVDGLGVRTYRWSRRLVDGAHNGAIVGSGAVSGSSAQLTFPVAEDGVTLVVLTPSH